jgi:nucleotide-binding universal stress UspA family protein
MTYINNMKTNKVSRVLIALDYNPTAQKVAELGFSMARSMNAEVVLLHVITDPVFYSSSEYSPIMGFTGYTYASEVQPDSVDGLKTASLEYLDKSKKHLGDNTIQTMVKEGDYADSILETAKEVKADIIVIGSHSRRWLENVVMGSVTEKVLHHTSIPLLIIPTKKDK